ncbi:hypothetical protein BD324DRAFT_618739 [Kockovaella imperatae]|uniref:ribonuclease Z n=1 Tax=Kockovaella imperatae TaxID=4999 RepID=A0A1Y1UNY1_9TREE|nr:hypothetical protein BD324DRAFT_618739 [Kockovaella imperatae]ORX39176.1 hypothetical protein BD324DRAFT_618739 [Kockovaella imperatae]
MIRRTKPSVHYAWDVLVAAVPSKDGALTMVFSTDSERYIFGAGENAQRALAQTSAQVGRTRVVMVGDAKLDSRGGLPGLTMKRLDDGADELDLIGPPDMRHFMATYKASVTRAECKLKVVPHPYQLPSGEAHVIYTGDHLHIKSIALKPAAEMDSGSGGESSSASRIPRSYLEEWAKSIVDQMFPAKANLSKHSPSSPLPLPPQDETLTDMVYILQGIDIIGKFDNAKAKELKVPFGPIRAKLVAGEAIEFEDPDEPGKILNVKAEDVVGETVPGPAVIIVTCSAENLDRLLVSPAFDKYQGDAAVHEVVYVIHQIPAEVLSNPHYRQWMTKFGAKTQHLIADTTNLSNEVVMRGSAWAMLKLSLLDEQIFPLPYGPPDPQRADNLPPNTTYLTHGASFRIHPRGAPLPPSAERDRPFPTTRQGIEHAKALYSNQHYIANVCRRAKQAVQRDSRHSSPPSFAGEDITVTTLGTGSAVPSKLRNVSATHLDIPDVGGILLDAGEGTTGQLYRRFGTELATVYENLKAIFISHMHGDHHLGIQSVLRERFQLGINSKLYIIGPLYLANSLAGSSGWQQGIPQGALDNIIFINNFDMIAGPLIKTLDKTEAGNDVSEWAPTGLQTDKFPISEAFLTGHHRWPQHDILEANALSTILSQHSAALMMKDLGFVGFRSPKMRHRGWAWGLVLEHESGWKISYSGDTMPCHDFITSAYGSTLMIHEATLDDEHKQDALEKGHSTFSQALSVGYQAKAQNLLLTHFSQRYPRVARLKGDQKPGDGPELAIAFDLMSIKIRDMWRMQYYTDAFDTLFPPEQEAESGDVDGGEDQSVSRAARKRQSSPSRFTPPPIPLNGSSKKSKQERRKPAQPQRATSPTNRAQSTLHSGSLKRSWSDR